MQDINLPIRDLSFMYNKCLSIKEKHKLFNKTRRLILNDMAICAESRIFGMSAEQIKFWFPEIFDGNFFIVKHIKK